MASQIDDVVPAHFTSTFFRRTLEHGLRRPGIAVVDVSVENITRGGENYCSNIYRAAVTFRRDDRDDREEGDEGDEGDDNEEVMSLIVKSLPAQKRHVLAGLHIYFKESLFYLDVQPAMEALMRQTKPDWSLAPRHFYSTAEPEQTIVFEDLAAGGFQLCSRQSGFDESETRRVLRKLGEYHAVSMVLAQQRPEVLIERYPFGLLNADSIRSPAFKALFGAQLLKVASLLADKAGFRDIAPKLLAFHDRFAERLLAAVYPLRGALNVLNHGDLWVNNILCAANEVRFIDFQLCFFGSPAFDVHYLLNTSVQLDVLRTHRQSLIEDYFAALAATLRALPRSSRPPALPTLEQLLQEMRAHEAYGFFVAFGLLPLMSMAGSDSHDNSLQKLHDDPAFARDKVELMFRSNPRTMATIEYALQRLDDLGVLN